MEVKLIATEYKEVKKTTRLKCSPRFGIKFLHFKESGGYDYAFKVSLKKDNKNLDLIMIKVDFNDKIIARKKISLESIFSHSNNLTHSVNLDKTWNFTAINSLPIEEVEVINYLLGLDSYKVYKKDVTFYEEYLNRVIDIDRLF